MFWKKKETEDKNFKEMLRMMDLVESRVAKLTMEVEILQLKARKKIFKDVPEEESKSETIIYNDGFDELRKLK